MKENKNISLEKRSSANAFVEELLGKAERLGAAEELGAQQAIEALIDRELLDEEEIVKLAAVFFSGYQVQHRDSTPYGIDISGLLECFKGSKTCMDAVSARGKEYKVDLASIIISSEGSDASWGAKSALNSALLSHSFQRLWDKSDFRGIDPVYLWCKYFLNSLVLCETVPPALLWFSTKDKPSAVKVTRSLSGMQGRRDGWPWNDYRARNRMSSFTEQVMRSILQKWPEDTAACFLLSSSLAKQGRYYEARQVCTEQASDSDLSAVQVCNLHAHAVGTYEAEIANLKRLHAPASLLDAVKEDASSEHRFLVNLAKRCDVPCDGYLQSYGLFEKDNGSAVRALEIAGEICSDYRRHLLLGMIYSSYSFKESLPDIYNLEFAIDHYVLAWDALADERPRDRHAKMSVLCPLASALHAAEKDDDAMDVCRFALSIKEEKNIRRLLSNMGVQDFDLVEASCNIPEILLHKPFEADACNREQEYSNMENAADAPCIHSPEGLRPEARKAKHGFLRIFGLAAPARTA